MVSARASCRIDLAGGTLDIWPLGLLHPLARTINIALDVSVTVRLSRLATGPYKVAQDGATVEAASPEQLAAQPGTALAGLVAVALRLPPFEAELTSQSPRGAGLGASSALAVALIAAAEEEFDLPRGDSFARAHLARDLEARLMSLPTGLQDHFSALMGGALEILPRPGGEEVRRLDVDLEQLSSSLVVVYSGQSHFSAGSNWQIVRRRLDGDPGVSALLDGIARTAAEIVPSLESGHLAWTGALMSREWSYRRRLAEGIETPVLAGLFDLAAAHGAWGGKACGAGGGGCLVFLCPPERKGELTAELARAGGQPLEARASAAPLAVTALSS